MRRDRWSEAIAALRTRGQAAHAAAARVEELRGGATSSDDRLSTAVAISYVAETDYLRSALALLRSHLKGEHPQRRLPVARIWPGPTRDLWKEWTLDRLGGVWRAIPGARLLSQLQDAGADALLDDVAEQLRSLQASKRGHRTHPRMYEKFIPDDSKSAIDFAVGTGGRSAPTLPGVPDRGHWINRNFATGDGLRIQPDRIQEANQLKQDEWAVHQRALSFGDAVLRLLAERHGETASQGPTHPSRQRGAARWIGREQPLVPLRTAWPTKLNPFQTMTLAGLVWLILTCIAIPLTVASKAAIFDHSTLLALAIVLIPACGGAVVYRVAPRLMALPGKSAAVPGIVAALAAVLMWQVQGPTAGYYFAGPWERYDRQFDHGCLAASPYRTDSVASQVNDGVLTVIPLTGETNLRLGPAYSGSTHPLRPLDHTTRATLRRYGC